MFNERHKAAQKKLDIRLMIDRMPQPYVTGYKIGDFILASKTYGGPMKKKIKKVKITPLNVTLQMRGETYGDFTDNARIAQGIKEVMRSDPRWPTLSPVAREALEVMAQKQSRIITGDPNYQDNWHDIQGYSKLAQDRCK